MRKFADLTLDRFWSSYVIKWKETFQQSPSARAQGFTSEIVIEQTIAVFIHELEEARKTQRIARFAFDSLAPWKVTTDGRNWHELSAAKPTQ